MFSSKFQRKIDAVFKTFIKRCVPMFCSTTVIPPYACIKKNLDNKVAIIDSHGNHSFKQIADKSTRLSKQYATFLNEKNQQSFLKKIGVLCSNDSSYTICQWSVWKYGAVVVPLATSHPLSELEYILSDSKCELIVSDKYYENKAFELSKKLSIPNFAYDGFVGEENSVVNDTYAVNSVKDKDAMIIYTSGTTGRPKGVVLTFSNLQAQKVLMEEAWDIKPSDTFLHLLPLHHIHGVMNALLVPLWVGATVHMLPKFDAQKTWDCLLGDNEINVLNAVPTIYYKLIEHYKKYFTKAEDKHKIKSILNKKIRVFISGSAPLPQPILSEWKDISSHVLLERYGMTECGMALTNPLYGERVPGAVGMPFPSVQTRIVSSVDSEVLVIANSTSATIVTKTSEELNGDLQVKGPSLFKEYLNKAEATKESFTSDGWFKTGDVAAFNSECNTFRIMGRASVDIIKCGGYKISALDIERHLLSHPMINEAAVLGYPDNQWGQLIYALLVTDDNVQLTLAQVKTFVKHLMPSYHIPKRVLVVDSIPRNAMGKVNKKKLLDDLMSDTLQ